MNWDAEILKEKFLQYESRPDSSLSFHEHLSRNNLAEMLNYHYQTDEYATKEEGRGIVIPRLYIDTMSDLGEAISKICMEINEYQYVRLNTKLFFLGSKTSLEEYDKFVEEFLKTFDISFLELYKRYKRENRIELKDHPYPHGTAQGRCYNCDDNLGNFVSALYKGRLKESSVLVHEIAHAHTVEAKDSSNESLNYCVSTFCEALSKYQELLYVDYLYENGKKKDAIYNMGMMLDNFIAQFEANYGMLLSLNEYNYFASKTIKYVVSFLLACKLYHLYHQNPEAATNMQRKLEIMIGTCSDYEIFKTFELENCKDSIRYTFDRYIRMKCGKKYDVNRKM